MWLLYVGTVSTLVRGKCAGVTDRSDSSYPNFF